MRRLILACSAVLSLVALVAAAGAAAGNGLRPVSPESPNAEAIRQTYWVILIVTGVIFVLVEGALLVFIVRFRRRGPRPDQEGAADPRRDQAGASFTIVPVLILAGIMAFVFVKLPTIKDVPAAKRRAHEPEDHGRGPPVLLAVHVPERPGRGAAHGRAGRPGRRARRRLADVIHSWWVPALGGKIDAIPGQTNHTWFQAEKAGTLRGALRRALRARARAHDRLRRRRLAGASTRRFLAAHTGRRTRRSAKEIFEGVCATCHGLAGQGDYGPKIQGSALLSDPRALEDLLRNGKNKMPPSARPGTTRR